MRRSPKLAKSKEAKPPVGRKSSKNDSARVRDLEKRLAEALKRESEAQGQLQTRNRELVEAHEQQTATSEILRVISTSPTDLQPVFDAIVRNAVHLCGASHGGVYRYDGTLVHSVAHDGYGYTPEQLDDWRKTWPKPVTASSAVCQAIRTRSLVRIADVETAAESMNFTPELLANLRARRSRSTLTVPMFRRDDVIGAISVAYREVGGFSDRDVELLKTFADQAVIAIENVRLFNETKEALERQTATAEILKVISSSPTDVQPVFDAIVQSAVRLCDGDTATAYRFDGTHQHLAAHVNVSSMTVAYLQSVFPREPERSSVTGLAILDRVVIHVPDIGSDRRFPGTREPIAATPGSGGPRAVLAVPMLQDGRSVGAIFVSRRGERARPFSTNQIELLQTFADQAVIAIENVRLFTELQSSNRELTRRWSSRRQRRRSCA